MIGKGLIYPIMIGKWRISSWLVGINPWSLETWIILDAGGYRLTPWQLVDGLLLMAGLQMALVTIDD